MSEKETGGSAFPDSRFCEQGMTLRDYFAAKAMQSLIIEGAGVNYDERQINSMTKTAYDWADAMLEARK